MPKVRILRNTLYFLCDLFVNLFRLTLEGEDAKTRVQGVVAQMRRRALGWQMFQYRAEARIDNLLKELECSN